MGRVRSTITTTVALVVVIVGPAALGACGSLQPKLDGKTIATGVERDAKANFAGTGAIIGTATCPAGREQRKGDRFDCHITIDHQAAVYSVLQTDGHGTVSPTLASRFVLFTTLDDQTLAVLRQDGLPDAKVACGYAHVWIVNPPATRDCVVTLADHSTHTARVSIASDGGVNNVSVAGLNP
ncbi:MAG TPA: hypothetical protein VGI86_20110 [Acidimicrobiia bacterium]|jgi:hypothetical protein